jgi:hypothetical protein
LAGSGIQPLQNQSLHAQRNMADEFAPKHAMAADDTKEKSSGEAEEARDVELASLGGKGDVLGAEHTDPALNAKMHLVNNVRLGPSPTRPQTTSSRCQTPH